MKGLGTITQVYRINIKKPVYALLLTDTEEGCSYDQVKSAGKEKQLQLVPTVASGKNYGDGVLVDATDEITGYEITTELTKLDVGVRADWYGHKFSTNGELIISKGDKPRKFAFGYEVEQTDSKREVVWLFKCSAQPFSNTVNQRENDIKYSSDSVKITAMCREFDGRFQLIGDTSNNKFTDAMADEFFNIVPTTITEATE